jgi:hypothetical protein
MLVFPYYSTSEGCGFLIVGLLNICCVQIIGVCWLLALSWFVVAVWFFLVCWIKYWNNLALCSG